MTNPNRPSSPLARRVRRGPALNWTDDDLDQLSAITPADIEAAQVAWRERAPRKYQRLLDAQPVADVPTFDGVIRDLP